MRAIERVLLDGTVVCAYSSGKDSSSVATLMLNAAVNVIRARHTCPQLVISHSDTGIENPLVRAIADGELVKSCSPENEKARRTHQRARAFHFPSARPERS